MSASGCASKWLARVVSSSLIWRSTSAMMPTVARVVAANAAVTLAGAASCSVPSAARISRARAAILRCRPPRLSADWIAVRLRWRPARGWEPGPAPPGRRRGRGPRTPPGQPGNTRATRCVTDWCVGYASADQVLMPGEHLDRLGLGAVAGDRAVVVPVGAYQIGQQLGIRRIGTGARDVVTVAVVGHRQRVDRIHLIADRRSAPPPTNRGRSRSRSPPARVPQRAPRPARAAAGCRSVPRVAAEKPAVARPRPSDTHRGGLRPSHRR